ncbi:MAG: hypothetical protein K9L85_03930 [Candidatus Peribacteraceae bacterium]|nr:hypothetical protein [Candidatus Peribacteraceae bacterium]
MQADPIDTWDILDEQKSRGISVSEEVRAAFIQATCLEFRKNEGFCIFSKTNEGRCIPTHPTEVDKCSLMAHFSGLLLSAAESSQIEPCRDGVRLLVKENFLNVDASGRVCLSEE